MIMRQAFWATGVMLAVVGCQSDPGQDVTGTDSSVPAGAAPSGDPAAWTDVQWQKKLTSLQFHVLRKKGTEWAFTGKYWNHKGDGIYHCAGCAHPLFDSATKFKSGTGWPSYWQPVGKGSVKDVEDRSKGMVRVEVVCARCNGHLGHVFPDGPKPTGLRYCINSAALSFKARPEPAADAKP